jgi:SAM-dependent methyltransferase
MSSMPYDRGYFLAKQASWSASAEVIVPVVQQLFAARSVVEFGCGTGQWLARFARHGAGEILGLDGAHVPRDLLAIPPQAFMVVDFESFDTLGRRFDLACSLEFAEHLAPRRAEAFVGMLVAAAPVVLFSAAIPGQGGAGHLNERRQSFWAALFAAHGYVAVDCIRPAVWGAPGMDWYYAQNTLIYCRPERVPPGHAPVQIPLYLDLMDERVFAALTAPPASIRAAAAALGRDAAALARALARRLGG